MGEQVAIECDQVELQGFLELPPGSKGLVLFAHGSGSSRFSPRNRFVADHLNKAQLGTLLFDLLTEEEEAQEQHSGVLRFDIDLLANRLRAVTNRVGQLPAAADLGVGYFGSSTGAAAALQASIHEEIVAVVSRGGRPDLASASLAYVRSPTLLIVGSLDTEVVELNEDALAQMHCQKMLRVIPGATHLFEEPGKLEQVAKLAADWFLQHFK